MGGDLVLAAESPRERGAHFVLTLPIDRGIAAPGG
jgi:hypothetical protein